MKNTCLKSISFMLVLVLLANMLPMSIFAEEYRESLSATPEISTEETDLTTANIVEEIVDKRTQYSKEFLLSNGLHMAAVYPDAVHYETSAGWAEIDNTLTPKLDGTYTNTAGVWNVSFPQTLTGAKSVTIEKDGYTLSFAMAGELRGTEEIMSTRAISTAEPLSVASAQHSTATITATNRNALAESYQYPEMAPDKLHSQLTYTNVYQNTDITYDLDSNTVKESIVLNAYSSTLRGYRYTLNVGDMVPVLEEDGQIMFYDAKQENIVMVMPAPYLVDAANEHNSDIQVQLTGSGSTYTLTYLLPRQWLAAEDRAWPVILDPVVTASLVRTNIRDCTVASKKTYSNNWSYNSCGYGNTAGIMRTYLKYRKLPKLQSSDVVVSATVSMYQADNPLTVTPVEVHKVDDTWESETINWSNMPLFNNTVEDYALVDSIGQYDWVVTDIVREWYANENTGMVFKASNAIETGGAQNFKQFYSADYGTEGARPLLAIFFRNNNGLEDYWDYTASSAGRAGTGYINNYTGNLVWVRDDLSITGNRMPVTIRHIYNANDSTNNSFGMGYGWRSNYNQLVYQWSVDSTYYVWEDADGTEHYFKNSSANTYKDEDGLELTLTTNGSATEPYCITDKYGNTSVFDNRGRLIRLTDNQQTSSSITITYASSVYYPIGIITDGSGRQYQFYYDSAGMVKYIGFRGYGSSIISGLTPTYENHQLKSIQNRDGSYTHYEYNDAGLLETATDSDGYLLTYAYYPIEDADWQPYRVMSVEESDNNGNTKGGSLTFSYAHNQTTVTDYNNNAEIYQFNDFGNTVCIQDDEGHATYTQYTFNTDEEKKNNTDNKKKGNQVKLSSKLQNSVGSLATDSSFENGTVWTPHGAGVTTSVTTDTAYHGSKSQKIVNSAYAKNSTAFSSSFNVLGGNTITASAFIKSPNNSTTLELHYYDSDAGMYKSVVSPTISANSSWQRAELTFTNPKSTALACFIHLRVEGSGTYYVDCLQIENANAASRYNLVTNGDFRHSGVNSGSHCWYYDGFSGTDGPVWADASPASTLDTFAIQMTGSPTATKQVYQNIAVSGSAEDTFILAGWAKGDSVPTDGFDSRNRQFCLKAIFYNTDGSQTVRTVDFNSSSRSTENWQYVAAPVIADKAYSSIQVLATYGYNANTVLFDGIQLYKEEFGSSYTYDDKGNVVSVEDLQGQKTEYIFDETTKTNLEQIKQNGNAKMTYTYDNWHNVKTATTQEGLVYNFAYDGWGNNTSVSITSGGSTMTSTATYSADGNRLESTTDALGNVTRYGYNEITNVLEWVQYPEDTDGTNGTADTRTKYTYDNMYRMASAACATDEGNSLSAAYTYTDDYLTKIQTPSTTYNFTYGDFGLRTGVSVGSRTLATYNYTAETVNDRKYDLDSLDYGNGDSVEYEYDDKGRVTKETFKNGDVETGTVTYAYDNNGALAKVTDSATGITTSYYYDLTDRMMKYLESGTNYSHSVGYEYDTLNNLTKLVETINGVAHSTTYTYDEDNRIESVTNGAVSEHYSYDGFGRSYEQITKHNGTEVLTKTATFKSPEGGKTSAQVATYTIDAAGYDVTYTYTYDKNGNITSVSDGTNTTSYVYDSANQLIRENNQYDEFTITWTYDDAGNMLTYKQYDYTTGALGACTYDMDFAYGDSEWGDLLTYCAGEHFTYDAVGNMTSDAVWDYTWEHGRQLASMSNGSTTWTYTYNADGLRTGRSNGTDTYSYIYNGSQLTQMTKGTDTLYFTYDANGAPITVTYNGVTYYYVTNLQGDIVAILDNTGTAVVHYSYDAWGFDWANYGTMASTLGKLNPLRYRGYIFDEATRLYYLQSRYYSPYLCRFLNADGQISGVGGELLGYNQFAYCFNNPVNLSDSTGNWPRWITAAVTVAAAVVTVVAAVVAAPTVATVAATVALVSSLAYVGQSYHYDEREKQNADVPKSLKDALQTDDYIEGIAADLHQYTSEDDSNTKICWPDGREAIYDNQGVIVNNPKDIGTYNFVTPVDGWTSFLHVAVDVAPWVLFGNNDNDPGPIINQFIVLFEE